ncbi:MAG: hypothetical protein MUF48_14190 [Pirellulaceae bacterium]|nr:hypothetical protein [Pirellulaceae bacterium]
MDMILLLAEKQAGILVVPASCRIDENEARSGLADLNGFFVALSSISACRCRAWQTAGPSR